MTQDEALKKVALTITTEAIRRYAALTNDFNPIHVDPDFAAKTEMEGIIAHGTLSLNLIWQSLVATLGADALKFELKIRFKLPVRAGDRLEAGGRANAVGYDVYVCNQGGRNVIEGVAIGHC